MIFSSYSFLLFLILFIIVYQLISNKYKIYLIFFANFLFYSFFNIFLSIALFFDLIINYILINKLVNAHFKNRRRIFLFAIIFNLLILFYFKYFNFFIENINLIFDSNYEYFSILLPIGISFFTFQLISYYVDLYDKKSCHNFFAFCNYIIFFPQLIAGPILRSKEIITKFYNLDKINFSNLLTGLKYFSYGLFIKVCISDNLGISIDDIFNNSIFNFSALDTLVVSYLFGFQIYFDFSGYCLMAIGASKIININLPINFFFPYFSLNIKEFWQRWNITLGTWVRDYIYLPIINKFNYGYHSAIKNNFHYPYIFSLLISWIVMGFWHGASWNFVIWGLFHFCYIALYRILLCKIKYEVLLWPIHINLIMISWLIFRISEFDILMTTFDNFINFENYFEMNLKSNLYLICFILLSFNFIIYLLRDIFFNKLLVKNNLVILIIFSIMNYFSFVYLNKSAVPFIYFQF